VEGCLPHTQGVSSSSPSALFFCSPFFWSLIFCSLCRRLVPTAKKNIKRTALGEKVGRIHMKKQNLDKMKVRRVDALRNQRQDEEA
jgi:hypothetical protein